MKGILVGYNSESGMYRVYYPQTRKIMVSHNVDIFEEEFDFMGMDTTQFVSPFATEELEESDDETVHHDEIHHDETVITQDPPPHVAEDVPVVERQSPSPPRSPSPAHSEQSAPPSPPPPPPPAPAAGGTGGYGLRFNP